MQAESVLNNKNNLESDIGKEKTTQNPLRSSMDKGTFSSNIVQRF
jgi:hypothetical protein